MKKIVKQIMRGAALAIPVSLAISCGGGSSSINDVVNSAREGANTGVFIDSAVEGVTYQSGRFSGETDSEGRFNFEEGATVRFSIGGIVLGEVPATEILTPLDLIGEADDDSHPAVINILRLLQTLDEDANPDNGIRIPERIRQLARNLSVTFNRDEDDFEFDEGIMSLVREQGRRMVGRDAALHHFRRERDRLDRTREGFERVRILNSDEDADALFATIDLNSDGSLDETEFKSHYMKRFHERVAHWFDEMDQNDDGSISRGEAHRVADRRGRHSNSEVRERFERLDGDDDEQLSREEFIRRREQLAAERSIRVYNRIDEDDDGLISKTEWDEFAARRLSNNSKRERLFNERDLDNDGQISLTEFLSDVESDHIERATEFFNHLDKNGDGTLTLEEEEGISEDDLDDDETADSDLEEDELDDIENDDDTAEDVDDIEEDSEV